MRYRTIIVDPPWEMPGVLMKPAYPTMALGAIEALPIRDLLEKGTERHVYLWVPSGHLHHAFHVLETWRVSYSATLVWCKPAPPAGGRYPSNVEFVVFGRLPGINQMADHVVQVTSLIADRLAELDMVPADLVRLSGLAGAGKWAGRTATCSQVPRMEHWRPLVSRVPSLGTLTEVVAAANARKGTERNSKRAKYAMADSRWFQWPNPRRHSQKPEAFLDMVEQVSPGPYLELFARRNRLGWDTWGNESLEMIDL